MSAKAVLVILNLVGSEDGRSSVKIILTILAAFLLAVALLLSAIFEILSSPVPLTGSLGEFQTAYAHLVTAEIKSEPLSEAEIEEMIAAAGTDDPDRQAVLRTALSLVGRVPYFWGGKSAAGWNEDWNTLRKITAPGISATGTYQPYGLDCSGYTDWVWRTAGFESIGNGVHAQFWASELIEKEELLPGDLVFKNWPDDSVINHVGIYYGKDSEGGDLYIHCSASGGGVVIDGYSGFTLWGRPDFTEKEEEI